MNREITQRRQISEIVNRARQLCADANVSVRHDPVDNHWLLLVRDDQSTCTYTAATLEGLLLMVERLPEHENEHSVLSK